MLPRLVAISLLCLPWASAQSAGPTLPVKESLSYNIEWRLITGGKARMEWAQTRFGWQLNLHVESVGMVSKLFKVVDDFNANLNPSLCTISTLLDSHEGSRIRETRVSYDYGARKASYVERDRIKNTTVASEEIEIPACVHDIVGGLFFIRTLNLEPGQSIMVPVSDGKKSASARVEAQQRDDIKTPEGVFHAIRYEVFVFDGVLFRRPAHLYVWLTDDRRRLPVQIRVRMQFTIGTITATLAHHD